jgi:hypothetical protein
MIKNFSVLFDYVKKIEKKQHEQKARGLNDYNMVNVVRKAQAEVGMHSNIIYSLLDIDGLHYQGRLFLDIFIETVLGIAIDDFGDIISVNAEELTQGKRRIDFTIKSTNFYIGIEMKVNASDLDDQIFDYHMHLSHEAENDNNQIVRIYYLTKHGKKPPKNSARNIETNNISFDKEIINWIDLCKREVFNITNLNSALDDYSEIVRKITKNYKGKVMTIYEELVKPESKEMLRMALRLNKEIPKAKGLLLYNFFEDVREYITSNDNISGVLEISDKLNDKNMVMDREKCQTWFTTKKEMDRNIGLFFSKNWGDYFNLNLCFYIMVASEHLHYGLVACRYDTESNKYILDKTPEDEKLKKIFSSGGDYRNWKSIQSSLKNSKILK